MSGFSEGEGGMSGKEVGERGELAARIEKYHSRTEAILHDLDGSQERAMRQRPTVSIGGPCSLHKKRTLLF